MQNGALIEQPNDVSLLVMRKEDIINEIDDAHRNTCKMRVSFGG
jgi:hypothetical protein